jgi:hypothetical protein
MCDLILPSAYKAALLIVKSSASGGKAPKPPPGLCPWTPLGDFGPQSPSISSPRKISRLRHWLAITMMQGLGPIARTVQDKCQNALVWMDCNGMFAAAGYCCKSCPMTDKIHSGSWSSILTCCITQSAKWLGLYSYGEWGVLETYWPLHLTTAHFCIFKNWSGLVHAIICLFGWCS